MNTTVRSDGTVGKALEILDEVAAHGRPVRFSELLEKSAHPKATLYRLLQTLTNQGMLTFDQDRHTYSLGLRLLRLAHSAWKTSSLAPVAAPFLDALAAEVGETIHLAQMENGQVLFIDKRKTTVHFDTLAAAGRVAPAHCTGVGKVILAHLRGDRLERALRQQSFLAYTDATHRGPESLLAELEQIRTEGVAFDREEHERGIISIAAPIMVGQGRVIGAVSVATSTSRHSLEGLAAFRPALERTVRAIGAEAEAWQFPA